MTKEGFTKIVNSKTPMTGVFERGRGLISHIVIMHDMKAKSSGTKNSKQTNNCSVVFEISLYFCRLLSYILIREITCFRLHMEK